MTYKIALDFTPSQIESMVDQLPVENKARLAEKLTKETAKNKLNVLFANIDRRRPKTKITEKEIVNTIHKVRKEMYARRSRH